MHDHDDDRDDHDRGLGFDLATLRSRRAALALFGGAGLAVLAGCGTGSDAAPAPTTTKSTTTTTAGSGAAGPLDEIPSETAGPFPGDGSNGPDVLADAGIVRADIRSSFGAASGTAEGVPLRIELTVVEADTGAALPGAAVYLWHCDRNGDYSLYSQAVAEENYLRGVQAADAAGKLAFTSIFPAAYSGRWPHAHFEVYPSVERRHRGRRQARHLAARAPPGRLREGLRHRRLRPEHEQPRADVAGAGHGVQRRLGHPARHRHRRRRERLRRDADRPGLAGLLQMARFR